MHISPLLHVTIAELFHGLSTCPPAYMCSGLLEPHNTDPRSTEPAHSSKVEHVTSSRRFFLFGPPLSRPRSYVYSPT